jgi:hypothetical protein
VLFIVRRACLRTVFVFFGRGVLVCRPLLVVLAIKNYDFLRDTTGRRAAIWPLDSYRTNASPRKRLRGGQWKATGLHNGSSNKTPVREANPPGLRPVRPGIGLRFPLSHQVLEVLNSALPAWAPFLSSPLLRKRGHSPGGGGRPLAGHKAHLQGHLLYWSAVSSSYTPTMLLLVSRKSLLLVVPFFRFLLQHSFTCSLVLLVCVCVLVCCSCYLRA